MNDVTTIPRKHSVCPHDCPSACALEVEVLDGNRIGRVYGSKEQTYTAGVICAKVARYAERNHHPDRLLYPMKRIGKKGEGEFKRISWNEALDEIGARFNAIEAEYGPEAIWPYHYAGTMGLVQKIIRSFIQRSASISHGPVSSRGRVNSWVPIRVKWRNPIAL
jgi:anaerobic selenocysteine-containing dehydrogenase